MPFSIVRSVGSGVGELAASSSPHPISVPLESCASMKVFFFFFFGVRDGGGGGWGVGYLNLIN